MTANLGGMSTRERWVTIDDGGEHRRMRADEWLEQELPRRLGACWTDADGLYAVIVKAIEVGAPAAVEEAVLRLELLEGNTERQAVAQALVLMAAERAPEAEHLLKRYLGRHPLTAIVGTNLAKAMWAQGREADAREQLRGALRLDPNLENGLMWWASIHGTEGGDSAYLEALNEIAAEPGAWRARVLLGRQFLQHGRYDDARQMFESVRRDFPTIPQAVVLSAAEVAGLERAPATAPAAPAAAVPESRLTSVPLFSPVWTRGLDEPEWIIEPSREGARICVFGFADARGSLMPGEMHETPFGRLSRALPLTLGEALLLRTDARVATVVPVVLDAGLFLSTTPYPVDTMVRYCPPVFPPRLVVGGTFVEPDHLRVEVWDIEQAACLLSDMLPASDPVRLAGALEARVAAVLTEAGLVRPAARGDRFIPAASHIQEAYLHAQSQLLTQLLAASRVIPARSISNEGAIYETCFGLCAVYPQLLAPRLMAISSVLAGLHYGSSHARDFAEGVRALLTEQGPHARVLDLLSPLVLRRLGDEPGAAAAAARLSAAAPEGYSTWLRRVARSIRQV